MATVPSETTAVAGTVLTAVTWNSNVRDAINFLTARPLFVGYQTAVQSTTSGTWTSILFDTEEADRDNGHSTTTNTSRYVSQTAGWYDIDGTSAWTANANGPRGSRIAVNGTAKTGRVGYIPVSSGSYTTAAAVSGKAYLNVGDYAEIQGAQISGGALNTSAASDVASYMSVLWVST